MITQLEASMVDSVSQNESCFSSARFLWLRDVQYRVGLGRSTIYRWMDEGKFPKPHMIEARTVRWLESDLERWMDEKLRP